MLIDLPPSKASIYCEADPNSVMSIIELDDRRVASGQLLFDDTASLGDPVRYSTSNEFGQNMAEREGYDCKSSPSTEHYGVSWTVRPGGISSAFKASRNPNTAHERNWD